MIKKVLIANRGEIAVRIIKTCKALGIKTVAIYSISDKNSLHVALADYSVCTEYKNNNDGYVNINNIIQAAINTKCDAIHPGYGFLSENFEFAKDVENAGLTWLGPSSDILKTLSDKKETKKLLSKFNIPVVNNIDVKSVKDEDFPLLIKATHGEGGRCIKKIDSIAEFKQQFFKLKDKSKLSLKDDNVIVEKYIDVFRHIEIQFAKDYFGNVIIFPERDCSVQNGFKKIIECTPSFAVKKDIIEKIKNDTKKLLEKIDYHGIGTAEYLVTGENYYFIEINPRIQVEHTVTEELVNVDLVKMQIDIANKENISDQKIENKINEFVIEARVLAKKASEIIYDISIPDGVRVDTAIKIGDIINYSYDPLIMKIICKGNNRKSAIESLLQALDKIILDDVSTNISELKAILRNSEFYNDTHKLNIYDEVITKQIDNKKIYAQDRLNQICDYNSFKSIDEEDNNSEDKIIIGSCKIDSNNVAICIMDANYKAGSIGKYLIDKIFKIIEYAKDKKLPLVILSCSGGIRVQEGVSALTGMAKIAFAINEYKQDGLFISVLTNPTYGGLNASLSSLGDINIAEIGSKIGFSGARIIANEVNNKIPEDFQTAEFFYKSGMADVLCYRYELKTILRRILEQYCSNKNFKTTDNTTFESPANVLNKYELLKSIRSNDFIRPYKIFNHIFTHQIEFHGDRAGLDDDTIKCFIAKLDDLYSCVIYTNRRNTLEENLKSNFGMNTPSGYKKAARFIKIAEKLNSPIIFLVDTPGADAKVESEVYGQAFQIGSLLETVSKTSVPIISFITGEANSGGAIGLISGDYLVMKKHSCLSVISPEAYSEIVYKKVDYKVLNDMKILPSELYDDKLIDLIIEDSDFESMIDNMKKIILNKSIKLFELSKEELIRKRKERIKRWGEYE